MKKHKNEIITRWLTPEGKQLSDEVFKRLLAGQSLRDLRLGEHEGRTDLRGLCAPEVRMEEMPPSRNWVVHKLHGQLSFRNVDLKNLDFTGAQLEYSTFYRCRIADCRFDNAGCKHWSLRAAEVHGSSFVGANLRGAALGPWYEGRGNVYDSVDFSRAEMRELASSAATYVDCDFSYARLDKVDFQSSGFIRCSFAGELREVMFYDHGFKTGKPDPNPMEDVDFSKAQLRWVAFRRLNLDRVRLPEDGNHIIVKNYRCVLEEALNAVKDNQTRYARGLSGLLENYLKWVGPRQEVGIFCRLDFLELWGQEGEQFATDLVRRVEEQCSKMPPN